MTFRRGARIAVKGLIWVVTILAALTMIDAGWGKFESSAGWQHWFGVWGYPRWFSFVIGTLELVGGLLLLVPRIAPYAAALLIGIMAVAFVTVTTKPTDLSQFDPVFNIALLAIVLLARWPDWLKRRAVAARPGS